MDEASDNVYASRFKAELKRVNSKLEVPLWMKIPFYLEKRKLKIQHVPKLLRSLCLISEREFYHLDGLAREEYEDYELLFNDRKWAVVEVKTPTRMDIISRYFTVCGLAGRVNRVLERVYS